MIYSTSRVILCLLLGAATGFAAGEAEPDPDFRKRNFFEELAFRLRQTPESGGTILRDALRDAPGATERIVRISLEAHSGDDWVYRMIYTVASRKPEVAEAAVVAALQTVPRDRATVRKAYRDGLVATLPYESSFFSRDSVSQLANRVLENPGRITVLVEDALRIHEDEAADIVRCALETRGISEPVRDAILEKVAAAPPEVAESVALALESEHPEAAREIHSLLAGKTPALTQR